MVCVIIVFKPVNLVLMVILLAHEACLRACVTNYSECIELVYHQQTECIKFVCTSGLCIELVYTSKILVQV